MITLSFFFLIIAVFLSFFFPLEMGFHNNPYKLSRNQTPRFFSFCQMTSDLIIYRVVLNEVLNVLFHVGFALSHYGSVSRQDAVHAPLGLYAHNYKHIPTSQQINNQPRLCHRLWTLGSVSHIYK